MMKLLFWNDKYTKTVSLFSTETSNTNCRLIRLNFPPSIRVSTLISAKLRRVPFPLNMIGKHESMESRGSFTISWFIIWNKSGWHMQISILYSNIRINLYMFKLIWKYLISYYTIIISCKRSILIIDISVDLISSSKSYCDERNLSRNTIYFCTFKPTNGKAWYRERKWKMWRQQDHAIQEYLI